MPDSPRIDMLSIMRLLGVDRPGDAIADELKGSIATSIIGPMFQTGGLCDGFILEPRPNQYFIAQEFTPGSQDLRQAIAKALAGIAMSSVRADDFYSSSSILCKISALIQTTPFGLYQLTVSQNRNVYLELGIALGLGRPFILVKDKDAQVASLLGALEYIPINSYLEFQYELGEKIRAFTTSISHYHPSKKGDYSDRHALIAHGGYNDVDFCSATAKKVAEIGFIPLILSDPTGQVRKYLTLEKVEFHVLGEEGGNRLDHLHSAVRSARFGVYQVDKTSFPDAFVALGIALGQNKPVVMVKRATETLPADLEGLSLLTFHSYTELQKTLPAEIKLRLKL